MLPRLSPLLLWFALSALPVAARAACAGTPPAQPAEIHLPPPRFCTRSLGVVDCWKNPAALNDQPQHQVADGPTTLTPAQQASGPRGW